MTQALQLVGTGTALAVVVMTVLWLIQLRTGNAAIVDVGWTLNIALLAGLYVWIGPGDRSRSLLLAAMTGLWALRLGGYLFLTRIWGQPEEGRYVKLREKWAPNVNRAFFLFYQAQAVLDVLLSLPVLIVALNPEPGIGSWEIAGAIIFAIGWIGETTADWQLDRFKRDPSTKGQTCRRGLWGWSRHPNYFFEIVVWTGWSVFCLGSPWGWLAFLCPALLLYFIFRVTGIPATEQQALRSRGDAYRRYQQEVSAFIPLPPKRQPETPASP